MTADTPQFRSGDTVYTHPDYASGWYSGKIKAVTATPDGWDCVIELSNPLGTTPEYRRIAQEHLLLWTPA